MASSSQRPTGWNWGYLIRSDKTAAPLLEQLCIGLSRIITKLGPGRPGPDHELKPEQLAQFYRSVGGNLDTLLLGSSGHGLSFMYRTLGCFHSLEPTKNAFETPKVPCLTPSGFVRWQTIQILLGPEEHVRYIQEALRIYDVPRSDGGVFPKSVPRDAFPTQPDREMEEWYDLVVNQLKKHPQRRIQSSPYTSPTSHVQEGREGYFGQIPRIQKPSRNAGGRSSDEEFPKFDSSSRRRSAPHIVTPTTSNPQSKPPNSYHRDGKTRSSSTQRDAAGARPRSATTDLQHVYPSHSATLSPRQHPSGSRSRQAQNSQRSYPSSPRQGRSRRTSADEQSSADEASSEDSGRQRSRKRLEDSTRSKSKQNKSLFPYSLNPFSHKRRHSHEAAPNSDKEDSGKRRDKASTSARVSPLGSRTRSSQQGQLRESAFEGPRSARVPSALDNRLSGPNHYVPTYSRTAPTTATEAEFAMGAPLAREFSSGSNTDARSGYDSAARHKRNSDVPLRISTVSGVGGRRYPSTEPKSAGISEDQHDGRVRYSVAAV